MIGVFIKNKAGMLCFVMPPQEERPEITEFRYESDGHLVTLTLADGRRETVTAEIAPELRESFAREKTVLVVHVDGKSQFEREYAAPLTK